jgi:hypothetical protein
MATAVPPPPAAAINRDILALVPRIGFRFAESFAISASFVINCILKRAAGGPPHHTFDSWLSLTFGANRQMVTDTWTIVMRRHRRALTVVSVIAMGCLRTVRCNRVGPGRVLSSTNPD